MVNMKNLKPWSGFALRVLWYGGSTFDAWSNIVAARMDSRLLNFPQATAQLGLSSAIVYLLVLTAIGFWAQSIINVLYLKYRTTEEAKNRSSNLQSSWHTTQLHEVIGGLLGPKWKLASLVFNSATLFYVSSAQLIACSNVAYNINQNLDKRTWTFVFGAVFSLTIFIPSAHNYRIWSFIGVITIIYDSAYITIATLVHEKVPNVTHTSPRSYQEYFTGLVGSMVIGHVPIPVEIMDAMWKPDEYQGAFFYGTICMVFVVMFPSISMERKFGDQLLKTPNALFLLPKSKFHETAAVLMIIHVFINFGMYSNAMYAMWEKLLRVHDSPSYAKRTISRLPVFLAFWVTALAFPFLGRLLDAVLVTWNYLIIPCAAYIAVYWLPSQRRSSKSFSRLGWATDFSISMGIILWTLIVAFGLGLWGDVYTFLHLIDTKLFDKCNDC